MGPVGQSISVKVHLKSSSQSGRLVGKKGLIYEGEASTQICFEALHIMAAELYFASLR